MDEKKNTPTTLPTEKQPETVNVSKSTEGVNQEKRPKKWLIISLLILALVALGVGVFFAYQKLQSKKKVTPKNGVPVSSPAPTTAPSPIPTVDPTASWSTFTKEGICYTFKYPKELTLNEENVIHLSLWGPTQKKDTEFYDGISLSFSLPLEIEKSLKEYVDSKIEEEKQLEDIVKILKPQEEITINGINGFTYTTQGMGTFQNIFLQSPDKTCTVEITNATQDPTNQGYQKTVDEILSTFKFVD